MTVLFFEEGACTDVRATGGKGSSLARLAALGLPVPPGYVVCADSLEQALAADGAETRLRERLAGIGDDAELAAAAHEAEAIVRGLVPDGPLAEEIREGYRRLGDEPDVAVRSSALSEDSEAASFAGQQETYLHVRGADSVVEHVQRCWGSFFTERALFYRRRKGSLDDLGMAVVVQRMVNPDKAGVLFTMDPVRRRRDQMVVEAVFGLGEAVVSGQVTPDHYLVARDGRLKKAKVHTQPHRIARGDGGGVVEIELSEAEGAAQVLDEDELRRLAELGRGLEERFGQPQDIEWAMEGGELYVLQARPVTA